MRVPKFSEVWAVAATVGLIFSIVGLCYYQHTIDELTNGNDNNQKIVENLTNENKELKHEIKDLEKEKGFLERKVAVLSEKNDNEIIDELEKQVKDLENEIINLNNKLEEANANDDYFINKHNELVLEIVDILNMNPDIFEKDSDGLLNPQYALYAIDSYVGRAFELSELQRMLYEATGIDDSIQALQYLINIQHGE